MTNDDATFGALIPGDSMSASDSLPAHLVDAALGCAFGPRSNGINDSVLRRLEGETGTHLGVHVPDVPDEVEPLASPTRTPPALRSSRYQVAGEIAAGGMGVVYKGRDVDLGRDVALKVLHARHAHNQEIVQRFVEEAQIGGQLQHPGIVPVYELGLQADDRPYFAMKLVKGQTLAAQLGKRRDASEEQRRWLQVYEQVCQTMAYAHARGVVHRDLKPSNVMVGAFGEVQVVDWGFAKVLRRGGVADEQAPRRTEDSVIATVRTREGSTHSVAGSVLGTPGYMAPEQAAGQTELLDERTDVFALGAVLCEILTGRAAYVAQEGSDVLARAAKADLAPAHARLDACGADATLVALAKRCLSPAPPDRPRDAQVLAQELSAHLTSVEERARRAELTAAQALVRAEGERRARRLTLSLAGSVLALVVLGGGGFWWVEAERQGRARDTERAVTAALSDAAVARGKQEWGTAQAALARAQERIDAGVATDDLRTRVADEQAIVTREADAAESAARLRADNEALLHALADVRQPEGEHQNYPRDWKKVDGAYAFLFHEHGLHPDRDSEQEAAAALAASGVAVELAAAVEDWSFVRRAAEDVEGAKRLLRVADLVDPDGTRRALREAISTHDKATLLALASQGDVAAWPSWSLRLLSWALCRAGEFEKAVALLRSGRTRYPQDFTLAMSLGRALLWLTPRRADEAVRHFWSAVALRPTSVEAWHELGNALDALLGDRAQAEDVFRTALALAPEDAHLHAHVGRLLFLRGDLQRAVHGLRRAVAIDPRHGFALSNLAIALHEIGDHDGAIEYGRRAIGLEPSCEILNTVGNALVAKGDLDAAIQSYERALELNPKNSATHNGLGLARSKRGDLDAAIQSLQTAIALDPTNAIAHSNLGLAWRDRGDLDAAAQSLRDAIERDPKSAVAHSNLGLVLEARGDRDGALQCYRDAVALDPDEAKYHNNVGSVLVARGDLDAAIASLEHAIELDPGCQFAHDNLGQALRDRGDLDGAIESFERAIALDLENSATHNNLGNALKDQGDVDGAIRSYQNALDLDPKNGKAHFNLGNCLAERGDSDGAIRCYQHALALDPKDSGAHNNLGNALRDQGELERAIQSFQHALEVDPQLVVARVNLGDALCERGDFGGAIECHRRALELDDAFRPAHVALARLLLTCPRDDLRDGGRALHHTQRAIDLDAESSEGHHLHGLTLYRLGQWQDAITALETAARLGMRHDPCNGLLLALAHHRLGQGDAARQWYDRCARRLQAQPSEETAEVKALRAEAEAALGITEAVK